MPPAVTDELVAEEARRLGEGGYPFTPRQLYYAVCAALDQPRPSATRGMVGLGVVLLALAGVVIRVDPYVPSAILTCLAVALMVAAPFNALAERRRRRSRTRRSRPRALSWPGFAAGPLPRAMQANPTAFAALVGAELPTGSGDLPRSQVLPGDAVPDPDRPAVLLACDRADTAVLLTASRRWLPEVAEVLQVAGGLGAAPPPVRGCRVVSVHDADPAGCRLPAVLREAGAREVIDAGLRPPDSDAGLQVIEGAPARVAPGLESDLTSDQIAWLLSGRRLELATLSPGQVVAMVLGAIGTSGQPARSTSEQDLGSTSASGPASVEAWAQGESASASRTKLPRKE